MKSTICLFAAAFLSSGAAWAGEIDGSFTREFRGVNRLELDSLFVATTVKGAPGSSLKLEAFDIPKGARVEANQEGGTLRVTVEKSWLVWLPMNRARLVLTIPETASCELASASGSIAASGIDGALVKIRTASGSIDCVDIGSVLEINSASGSVSVKDTRAGTVIKTASGSISLEKAPVDAVLFSRSGSIEILEVDGAIKIDNTSGRVLVKDFSGRLYIRTVSGSIGLEEAELTGESLFQSTSGSIKLELENRREDFRIKATTVSGSVSLFGDKMKGGFEGGSGAYPLTLGTVSGSIRVQ